MNKKRAILWFRDDLRLANNLSLAYAVNHGYEVLPLFIDHRGKSGQLELGSANKWWLHQALADLEKQVGKITYLKGEEVQELLLSLIKEMKIEAVFWNRRYLPEAVSIDKAVKQACKKEGIEVKSFVGNVLHEPFEVCNKSGKPFQVFTPFWKHCLQLELKNEEVFEPKNHEIQWLQCMKLSLDDLGFLPDKKWADHWKKLWNPTRAGGLDRCNIFAKEAVYQYGEQRDFPIKKGTSTLSPWLHFGQLSMRELHSRFSPMSEEVQKGFVRQFYWREFSLHLVYHFTHLSERGWRPLRLEYDLFEYSKDAKNLDLWQRGITGYPIVDAAMRQLWQTGWMHNRLRMIVASFLIKHLQQDWREGLAWFADTLLDADLPNNMMGWQWCAGCGADAAPYFRIFNPILQGKKFDPEGTFVKNYVPELGKVPARFIHHPWEMGELELAACGVKLGIDYPHPIIDHQEGRKKALDAYEAFKHQKQD